MTRDACRAILVRDDDSFVRCALVSGRVHEHVAFEGGFRRVRWGDAAPGAAVLVSILVRRSFGALVSR